jgi:polysaccharide biosynthesis/export protein
MRATHRALKNILAALALAAFAFLDVCAVASADAYSGADYRLGVGDKIRVIVYDEADLSGDFQVDATGNVRLPMIGEVRAGGLTAHDLEASIGQALGNGYLNDPRVSVEVTTYRPFYVIGEVLKPGEYPYANGMTTSSAVALAGGFTSKAVESVIYVRHEGENKERRLAATDTALILPGDVVRIDSTAFWDVMDVLSPLAGVSTLRYTFR